MTEVQGGPPAPPAEPGSSAAAKFKTAAPVVAGAIAVVAAIVGASLFTKAEEAGETPIAVNEAVEVVPATPPAALPDPAANPAAPQPGNGVPGVAQSQTPITGVTQGMEIVVKFKDEGKVKDIIDAFWKDQASARAKFDALKARRPEFASLKLDRVTYSNELVLVHDGGQPAGQRIATMRAAAAKLKDVSDISYAEPNLTAQPGGQ